jgi:spore coat protein U-like protein
MKKFLNIARFMLPSIVLGLLALNLAAVPATAATISNTFLVSTSVSATCTASGTPITFGAYTGVLAQTTGTGTVTCTNTTPYNIGFDAGTSVGATVTSRKMTGPGGALLSYQLFSDPAYSVNWGNTIGTDTVAGVGNGLGQAHTIYGQIPAGQYFTPGAYSDTVTATLTY